MKYAMGGDHVDPLGRLPHGRRGLKFDSGGHEEILVVSPPAWEAGIEISNLACAILRLRVASRMGGGD